MGTGQIDSHVSFTRATIVAAAGLLAAFATQATPATILPAALTGTEGALLKASGLGAAARTVNVTTSASVGSYVAGSKVTVSGVYGGKVVSEALVLVAANGSDLIKGVQLFDYITGIVIDAQVNTSGQFSLGVGDIGAPFGGIFRRVKAHTTGNVVLGYQGGYVDTNVMVAGNVEPCGAQRVVQTTAVGVTVYY